MKFEDALIEKINTRTKPLGSLGKLEQIAYQVGCIQQTLTPEFRNPAMLVFAADHGIAEEGVSPCPKEITYQQIFNFKKGGGGISVFCRQHGFKLEIVDAGVDFDFPIELGVIDRKIARGSRNMRKEPAMTVAECKLAMHKGAELVKEEYDRGCNVIGFGEMGIGNTSPSSLLFHKFTGVSLEECVGRGAGHDEDGVLHKLNILKEVAGKYSTETPLDTLATFGGLEIAMMVGAILESKRLNMTILCDGFIATGAVITALQMEPTLLKNVLFCHYSNEKGHRLMLEYLKVDPILTLDLRLGEGTGAVLSYPIIQSALIFLNEMSSFDEAKVFQVHNK